MFNLPFPTDSLYKFAFMFGLALIIFSFYYKDTHLNKFDEKQVYYKIYSLGVASKNTNVIISWDSIIMQADWDSLNAKANDSTISKNDIKNRVKNWLPFKYNKLDPGIAYYFDCILRDSSNNKNIPFLLGVTKTLKSRINKSESFVSKNIILETNSHTTELTEDQYSFYALIILGVILFTIGTIFWYIKIQLPQDKLLKMQTEQSKHSHMEFLNSKKEQHGNNAEN